jgi:hypothetical protein
MEGKYQMSAELWPFIRITAGTQQVGFLIKTKRRETLGPPQAWRLFPNSTHPNV